MLEAVLQPEGSTPVGFVRIPRERWGEAFLIMEREVTAAEYLEFLNDSVMGSVFSRYKSPAFANLAWKPTFTWHLLRKDFELGLELGRDLDVPLPASAAVHQIVMAGIGRGWGDEDFAAMLEQAAEDAGRPVEPENVEVDDGLSG